MTMIHRSATGGGAQGGFGTSRVLRTAWSYSHILMASMPRFRLAVPTGADPGYAEFPEWLPANTCFRKASGLPGWQAGPLYLGYPQALSPECRAWHETCY